MSHRFLLSTGATGARDRAGNRSALGYYPSAADAYHLTANRHSQTAVSFPPISFRFPLAIQHPFFPPKPRPPFLRHLFREFQLVRPAFACFAHIQTASATFRYIITTVHTQLA